jgi:hypothetical protein
MARFFHWGRHGRWHDFRRHRGHGPEGDDPGGPPGFPFPPIPFPPLPFELESDVNEDEFAPADEEAEMHHRHRRRWQGNQGEQEFDEGADEGPRGGMEVGSSRRSGRWVRHRGGIVLFGV